MSLTRILLLALALVSVGCDDSDRNAWRKIGSKKAHLTCYSGTATIYDGNVSGLVTEDHTDGWNFYDGEGRWIRVSGACVAVHQ